MRDKSMGRMARVASVGLIFMVPFLCVLDTRAQTYGPTYSLVSLTNSGGDITVGDKDFYGFFTSGLSFQATSNITVTGFTDANGNYGLQFGGGFVAYDNLMDFQIGYQVMVTNSPDLISGAALSFNGAVVPTNAGSALAEVVESVYTNMYTMTLYGQMSVYAASEGNGDEEQLLSTNMAINPPQSYLSLEKDILVDSFTITAFASITTIDQTYMQVVPEPSTIVMVGLGLFGGLALLRRRCG